MYKHLTFFFAIVISSLRAKEQKHHGNFLDFERFISDAKRHYQSGCPRTGQIFQLLPPSTSAQPKMNLKAALDSLVEKVPKLLPSQDILLYLLRCDKLNSPKKYLEYYERPIDVVLDSDLTWPVYGKKFPYSIELT